jgi:hypothetical protein
MVYWIVGFSSVRVVQPVSVCSVRFLTTLGLENLNGWGFIIELPSIMVMCHMSRVPTLDVFWRLKGVKDDLVSHHHDASLVMSWLQTTNQP